MFNRRSGWEGLNLSRETKEEIEKHGVAVEEIDYRLIDDPAFHDRKVYDQKTIEELAENIREVGLIEPIIIRKKGDRYERIVGFRRLEAYKHLHALTGDDKWQKIPAIVLDVDDETAVKIMLSENIFREDLNEYDKLIATLEYLSSSTGLDIEDVKALIHKISRKRELTPEETEKAQQIENLLKTINQTPHQVRWKLPLLELHPVVKEAVIQREITPAVAIELNKLADNHSQIMIDLMDRLIKGEISLAQLRKEILYWLGEEQKLREKKLEERINHIKKKLKKIPPEKKEKIEKLLAELEREIDW